MKGPYLGSLQGRARLGRWHLVVTLWPSPRFWSLSWLTYRRVCTGFCVQVGPLELEVVR